LHLEPDQLRGEISEPLESPLRPTGLDDDVLSLHPAEFTEPLPEVADEAAISGQRGGGRREPADTRHFRWRLRGGCERRAEETESEDEDDADGTASHGSLLMVVPMVHLRSRSFHCRPPCVGMSVSGSRTPKLTCCRKR